jgi:hypothetical protein
MLDVPPHVSAFARCTIALCCRQAMVAVTHQGQTSSMPSGNARSAFMSRRWRCGCCGTHVLEVCGLDLDLLERPIPRQCRARRFRQLAGLHEGIAPRHVADEAGPEICLPDGLRGEAMICPRCHDSGYLVRPNRARNAIVIEPCPECNSHRVIHCCEGDRAQPDPEMKQDADGGVTLRGNCRDARIRCMCDHDPAFFRNSPISFELPISEADAQDLFAYMNNRFKRWTGKELPTIARMVDAE